MLRLGRWLASVAAILVGVAELPASARAGTPLRLSEMGTTFNGIALGHGEAGLLRSQLLPRFVRLLGAPRRSLGHMCPHGALRVEVDQWYDLTVVFAGGEFIELDYNRGGWSLARRLHPPLPATGAPLRPLVQTTSGVAIGTTLARARVLDPSLRGTGTSEFVHDHLELSVTRESSIGWVVTQISARYANAC